MTETQKANISKSMVGYWDGKRQPRLQKNGYYTICIGNKKYEGAGVSAQRNLQDNKIELSNSTEICKGVLQMITFQDIEKANGTLQSLDVKGKPYIEVNQRIKAFRMLFPTGFIVTEMLSNENGVCVFRATVGCRTEEGEDVLLGTGTAYEKESSSFINKTSYIENCETSAVGRALGMCGFGIDVSVASYEEVQNAINNQGEKAEPKATAKQVELLQSLYNETEMVEVLKWAKVSNINDISVSQASALISKRKGK